MLCLCGLWVYRFVIFLILIATVNSVVYGPFVLVCLVLLRGVSVVLFIVCFVSGGWWLLMLAVLCLVYLVLCDVCVDCDCLFV